MTEDQWIDRIDALLQDATRIRLRADVPLGVFLSGGIDSGLVAAIAAREQKTLSSFTMGFDEERVDETEMSLLCAKFLKLNPITRRLPLAEAMLRLPSVMGHFDEPFADCSSLPTSVVCEEARKQFTVMLSGDGGDEMFAGYGPHLRAQRWRHLDRIPRGICRMASRGLIALSKSDTQLRRFARRLAQPVGTFGMGGTFYVSEDWQAICLKPKFGIDSDELMERYSSHLGTWSNASSLDIAQRTDLRMFLLEDILDKVDRMSMKHSLEVRSPFLDYRMVELGLSIPSDLRLKGGIGKYLLRQKLSGDGSNDIS